MYRNNFCRFLAKIWPKKIASRDGCGLLIPIQPPGVPRRQQPWNDDFSTGPYHWEVTVALTTAAKLQQVRANSREMTSQKLNEEHEILRRFMAVVISSAFLGVSD